MHHSMKEIPMKRLLHLLINLSLATSQTVQVKWKILSIWKCTDMQKLVRDQGTTYMYVDLTFPHHQCLEQLY